MSLHVININLNGALMIMPYISLSWMVDINI